MSCDLCELNIRTKVYHENDHFIVLDCIGCTVPMIVWKEHTMELPEPDTYIMEAYLKEVGDIFFGEGNFYIDKRQRTISDHLHWHTRRDTRRRKEDVRPVWIQERMGVDEC